MDHAEALALGIDLKDITSLETSGLDFNAFRRVLQPIVSNEQLKAERIMRDDYERKFKEVSLQI